MADDYTHVDKPEPRWQALSQWLLSEREHNNIREPKLSTRA